MPTIEIYPDCKKPEWCVPGAECLVWGEGSDICTIAEVHNKLVVLSDGSAESFTKLHRTDWHGNLSRYIEERENNDLRVDQFNAPKDANTFDTILVTYAGWESKIIRQVAFYDRQTDRIICEF